VGEGVAVFATVYRGILGRAVFGDVWLVFLCNRMVITVYQQYQQVVAA
jgi:hypothetical protein